MRVAVAGAGIGGLTLALALHARGLGAVVCERAPELGEAGAGVQLGPNAVKVLDRLGLGEALRAVAFRPDAAEVREARGGRLLLRTPLAEQAERRWGAPYLQVHRSDLQALLLDAVGSRGAAELRLAAAASHAGADGLQLEDGRRVMADAVVGADGLRSAIAASLHGEAPPRFTDWAAWRAVVAREAVGAPVPPVASVWAGAGGHLVHYPVRGGREINVVAVTPAREPGAESWTGRGDPAELVRRFAGWSSPGPQLLEAAAREKVWRWPLYDRPPRPVWSRGRATLLGDAAHPMLPFLAQGAAMAIEDAWELALALSLDGDVERALSAYEAARRPRTMRVQAASRRNALLFHLPPPVARLAFGGFRLAAGADAGATALDWLYGWEPR